MPAVQRGLTIHCCTRPFLRRDQAARDAVCKPPSRTAREHPSIMGPAGAQPRQDARRRRPRRSGQRFGRRSVTHDGLACDLGIGRAREGRHAAIQRDCRLNAARGRNIEARSTGNGCSRQERRLRRAQCKPPGRWPTRAKIDRVYLRGQEVDRAALRASWRQKK